MPNMRDIKITPELKREGMMRGMQTLNVFIKNALDDVAQREAGGEARPATQNEGM